MTIQEAIDAILAATGAAPIADTVDTVKTGDPTRRLTGVVPIAPLTLADLVGQLKARLGTAAVRVTGPDDLVCRRVGLLVGAPGGRAHIAALARDDVDAVVCGEINEWEACEYARDATFLGRPRGPIVVGHANSEEAGMAYLATWLRPHLPDVPITHVPAGDPLRTL